MKRNKGALPILEMLRKGRVFSISGGGDEFEIVERCDEYFACTLSKDKLLALADEITRVANGEPCPKP